MDHRKRNQLLGCMHAHNELTFLTRLLLFSQNPVSEGELHDHAQSSQMWCVLQLLAGKLYETWNMLGERFSLSENTGKKDDIIAAIEEQHRVSLTWLRQYFSNRGINRKAIVLLRNKTAFHYDGLDMGQAVKNLAPDESTFHIAQHPANSLYWLGSAVVFRTIFAEIAVVANPATSRTYHERVEDGLLLLINDVGDANFHLHQILYGLITVLVEDVLGQPLGSGDLTTIDGAPTSRQVALCPWLDIPAT
jgi:hypothetical protein